MRILEISNFFWPKTSGSGKYCLELSRRLAERHEVTVLTSRIPHDTPVRETLDGVAIERLPAMGEGWNISALSLIIPRLREIVSDYDFVHLHSYLFLISNQVGLYRKFREFPLYLHLHGGLAIPDVSGFKPFFKRHLYDPIMGSFMFGAADRIFSISRTDMEVLKKEYGIKKEMHWVPNGIDANAFPFSKKGKNKRIAYIGRLERWKGVSSLPGMIREVWAEDKEISWSIVGGGPLKDILEKSCKELPVEFFGDVPHEQIPGILSGIDMLVLPSLIEGVPTVALEALCSGCAVIARNVGGISEIVDSSCGFLLEKDEEFPEKILSLFKNPALLSRMGEEGRKKVESTYDWRAVLERFERIISL